MTEPNNLTNDLLKDPFSTINPEPNQQVANAAPSPRLNDEQLVQAKALANQIDVNSQETVLNYGASAQKQLGKFSQTMLDQVQSQDTGEVGQALTTLMNRLQEANPDELRAEDNNVFRKLFGQVKRSILKSRLSTKRLVHKLIPSPIA